MPRPRTFRTKQFPYHFNVRCNNREFLPIPKSAAWNLLSSNLMDSAERYGVLVHAFVMMSNHLHLLASTPNANVDRFASHFLSVSSVRIAKASGRENHIFGTRYRPTVLETAYSFAYVLKYIYRNPVRAGICNRAEEYEFSTLAKPLASQVPPTNGFDALVPSDRNAYLSWLNKPTPREQEELLRKALRRRIFKITSDNNYRRILKDLRAGYGVETGLS